MQKRLVELSGRTGNTWWEVRLRLAGRRKRTMKKMGLVEFSWLMGPEDGCTIDLTLKLKVNVIFVEFPARNRAGF